jgi:hypothetical protein
MGQEQRSKCCNSKVVFGKDNMDLDCDKCFKCERILSKDDIYTVTTKATVKLNLQNK